MTVAETPLGDIRGDVVMRAVGITKSFGGVHAIRGVDFDIRAAEVTVLFGENGAGKSTLMKILAGVQPPTSGHLELDGEVVSLKSAVDAAERGIAIIHQELSLCPNLSVRDNVFLGREVRKGLFVDGGAQDEATRALMRRLEQRLQPRTLVGDLRLGQQQLVEIARALAGQARVLIMDEPTSALSAPEVTVLFEIIGELTAAGVAIVYISHHLEEALEIADHAVVFRDGLVVGQAAATDIDINWVISNMVGRSADALDIELNQSVGDTVLSLSDITVIDQNSPQRLAVDGVSLDVRAGEIVCLYGLMGAGRTELLEAVAGRQPIRSGTVTLNGLSLTSQTVAERIRLGMALVPEDRQRDGLVQTMTVGENLSLTSLRDFVRGVFLAGGQERRAVKRSIEDVNVRTAGPGVSITTLSGGNQQKVVVGKVLMTQPLALLLDEPTRGVDVGARAEIFALMLREAERGLAMLYATSEINEALKLAHRVIVMSKGRVVGEFDPATATKDEVMIASGESIRRQGHRTSQSGGQPGTELDTGHRAHQRFPGREVHAERDAP